MVNVIEGYGMVVYLSEEMSLEVDSILSRNFYYVCEAFYSSLDFLVIIDFVGQDGILPLF